MNTPNPTTNSVDDTAPGKPRGSDSDTNTPHARHAERLQGKPDQLKDQEACAEDRQEALIDEGVEETFPASDPVSAKRIT